LGNSGANSKMVKNKDTLKFFQTYVKEMIDIGGKNLPIAISSKLGSKLGKFYKGKKSSFEIDFALNQMYLALDAKPLIKKLDDDNYEVTVKYSKKFCPIGGDYNPSRASIFQNNICIPYVRGFLNELFPEFTYGEEILNCIPLKGQKTCHYILKLSKKIK
jgi:hypothetical protein